MSLNPQQPDPAEPDVPSEQTIQIECVEHGVRSERDDIVTIEEPMEIRVVHGPPEKRKGKGLSVTMRTPGHDVELAVGFLFTEGIIHQPTDVDSFARVGPPDDSGRKNTLRIELAETLDLDTSRLQRHFYTTSSCGVCGKSSLDAIRQQGTTPVPRSTDKFTSAFIHRAGTTLRQHQQGFEKSGGIHAAALFDVEGNLIEVREDVGRHNALDKLIGSQLIADSLPLTGKAIMVSGRTSFELLQKTITAGAELLIAVGAPSSLAVELAREFQVTLVGFASETRFNIYAHGDRIEC